MNGPKMNPALLRLLVIFPNVLSYILLFGIIVFIITNFQALQQTGGLILWGIVACVLAPMAAYTTYSIIKKIRAGQM